MADQWPSAGRVVHVKDRSTLECRGASIVRVFGEPREDADVELFVYPSTTDEGNPPFEGRVIIHRDEWHFPEYVGPAAEV